MGLLERRFFSKGVVAVFLALALLFVTLSGAGADSLEEKLKATRAQEAEKKQEVKQAKNTAEYYAEQVAALDRVIEGKDREIQEALVSLLESQRRVLQAQKRLAEAEDRLEKGYEKMGRRLKAIYMNNSSSYLLALASSESIADFEMRWEMLLRLVMEDKRILKEVEDERKKVAEEKATLEAERDRIAYLTGVQQGARLELEKKQKEKEVLLAAAQRDLALREAELDRLEEQEQASSARSPVRTGTRAAATAEELSAGRCRDIPRFHQSSGIAFTRS